MSKLASKRIELAKQVLETTDKHTLDAVEDALRGTLRFSKAEVVGFESILERIEKGEEPTRSWAEVKKGLAKRAR
jgi:hypothetical protein